MAHIETENSVWYLHMKYILVTFKRKVSLVSVKLWNWFICTGFTSVVLSTIERRYKFSSVYAGMIASMYDISVVFSVLVISYFAGRGHRPRWLGICLIIQGVGKFIAS